MNIVQCDECQTDITDETRYVTRVLVTRFDGNKPRQSRSNAKQVLCANCTPEDLRNLIEEPTLIDP